MRVMRICEKYTQSIPVLAAAILHDVLEDTPVTKADLSAFLEGIMDARDAQRTLQLVVELTDIYTKPNYPTEPPQAEGRRGETNWNKQPGCPNHQICRYTG